MIDTRTEELAALFVLDLLDSNERKRFESQLANSPELKQLVREMSAALYNPAKKTEVSPRPDLLVGILSRIEGLKRSQQPARKARKGASLSSLPWTYIWASAALLFLALNLVLLMILNGERASLADTYMAAAESDLPLDSEPSALPSPSLRDERMLLSARITRLENALSEAEETLMTVSAQRDVLLGENEEIKTYNSGWQREYARLVARFLPFFEPEGGLSRFTVIELMDDSGSAPRSLGGGFAELAGRFLSGESKIAGVSSHELMGPFFEGAGVASAQDSTRPGLSPVAQEPSSRPGIDADTSAQPPSARSDPLHATEGDAVGFSVWRDHEQKGFLDVYNLPSAGEGQQAYLWVRSSELEPYLPVGELPELENGRGSLFYSVDEPNFTPTEILITAEPEQGVGSQPGGSILLRGP